MSKSKTQEIVEKIFNQAKEGVVKIGDDCPWVFYTKFFTNINNNSTATNSSYPIIKISDYPLFLNSVEEYLKEAKKFYSRDEVYFDLESNNDFAEKLFLDLMINTTCSDHNNIISYIQKRTKMLQSPLQTGRFDTGVYQGYKMTSIITKRWSNLESPYAFIVEFRNPQDGTSFILPSITFGIADGVAEVGAIQNDHPNQGFATAKKLDRHFRKVNKDVDSSDIIANVSPNALVAFTLFNAYLKTQNIRDITSTPFQPIRYNSKKTASFRHSKSKEETSKIYETINRDQFNITNKVLYLFLRYEHHFDNATTFFDENTQTIHMNISNAPAKVDENIIHEIYNSFNKTTSAELTTEVE